VLTCLLPDELTWESGVEYGLEAVALVRQSEPRLRVVLHREGPLREAAAFAVFQLGLAEVTAIRGVRPVDYGPASVVLLPRLRPGPSLPLVLALAAGAAAVTSDPSLTGGQGSASLVPARDPASMAARIRGYALDRIGTGGPSEGCGGGAP
jgi:glycosyltransferase involved in cell wall biosynthesis